MRRIEKTGQAGFTLVELMISLTVLSIAISAAFAMAYSLMNGYRLHRGAVAVESTSRIVLDIIAGGIRSSSPGMSSGQVFDVCTGTTIDTIEVINDTSDSDELRIVHALGGAVASLTSSQKPSVGVLTVDDNASFEQDLWMPGVIVDPLSSQGHLVEILAPSADSTSIEVRTPGECVTVSSGDAALDDPTYPAGSFVIRAVHMHYFVDPPFLMVDPDGPGALVAEVMADGIEDLQIAIGVESDGNTSALLETVLQTDDEWHNNNAGDAAPAAIASGDWRALRVTIVGVENREIRSAGTQVRPAVEDRAAASSTDSFRRRVYSTTIQLRNFAAAE